MERTVCESEPNDCELSDAISLKTANDPMLCSYCCTGDFCNRDPESGIQAKQTGKKNNLVVLLSACHISRQQCQRLLYAR